MSYGEVDIYIKNYPEPIIGEIFLLKDIRFLGEYKNAVYYPESNIQEEELPLLTFSSMIVHCYEINSNKDIIDKIEINNLNIPYETKYEFKVELSIIDKFYATLESCLVIHCK